MNEEDIKRWMSRVPWWVIVALFIFSPFLATILLLVKLFAGGKDPKVIDFEYAPPLESVSTPKVDTRINKPKKTVSAAIPENQKNQKNKKNKKKKSTGRGMKIAGLALAFIGFFTFGDFLDYLYWDDFFAAIAFLIGGGALFFKGWMRGRDQKEFHNYMKILGDRSAISIDELARIAGVSNKTAEKDLKRMVQEGYFGDTAYVNMELGYLFRDSEADRAWREKQDAARESNIPKEAEDGYSGILRNIRRANDKIADPVLSAKIDQLEDITARIFRAVEADPSKTGQIDRFLNYYLPTTQKLLDSYAEFESAGIEGENLSNAKARISSTMDMIIKGFSRQLDELYKSDFMDVDSDIRVMETMLKRDTGSVSDDFGLGRDSGKTGNLNGGHGQSQDDVFVGIDFGDTAAQTAPEDEYNN